MSEPEEATCFTPGLDSSIRTPSTFSEAMLDMWVSMANLPRGTQQLLDDQLATLLGRPQCELFKRKEKKSSVRIIEPLELWGGEPEPF